MNLPSFLPIAAYSYPLPEDRIARYPLAERDQSKLLVYENGQLAEDRYRNLANHLPIGTRLFFNNTRVVAARLFFFKASGGRIELFCLEPSRGMGDVQLALQRKGSVEWICLVGGASKWKHGLVLEKSLTVQDRKIILEARYLGKEKEAFVIQFDWSDNSISFSEILAVAGQIPLPPYLKRPTEASDQVRYQTIYAKEEGSVAAPTAGLHFTETVMRNLDIRSIKKSFLTLHVGAGTFLPVKSETIGEHLMHAESIVLNAEVIDSVLKGLGKPLVAVGTTSLRTLETLYWLGIQTILNPAIRAEQLKLSQWQPYEQVMEIAAEESLRSLLHWMSSLKEKTIYVPTSVLIAPGYQFRIVDGLVTNFHQPQSTLLLLIAAFIGEDWRKLYQYALENDFRFLSYGDGSLLWHRRI